MGFLHADYNKNGPGVAKDEPKKKGFFLFWEIYFRKFWRLITLNFLFVLSCCTVICIGPAMAGFSYVLRNFSREKHAFVWDDFVDTAKKNFKQAFTVCLINSVLFAVLGFAVYFWYSNYAQTQSFLFAVPLACCVLGLFLLLFMQYYMYLMLVTFDIGTAKLYKNSLILAVYALPRNILTTLILAVSSLFVFTVTTKGYLAITALGVVVMLFFYFSFVGLAVVSMSYPVIQRVMIDPYKNIDTPTAPKMSEDEPALNGEALCSDEQTEEKDE